MRIGFAHHGPQDFHVATVDSRALGGSESTACYLARALAQLGHEVVFLSNTSAPGEYHGVACRSLPATSAAELRALNLDVLVCVLIAGPGAGLRADLGPGVRLVLWSGHAHDQPGVQPLLDPEERNAYDGFAMVSEWQSANFLRKFALDPARMQVLRNTIAPAFVGQFPPGTSVLAQKASPPVLAYTSTPFRGLDLLIEAFPRIRAAVPGARLEVFSSMSVYGIADAEDEANFGPLYRRCRETEGVDLVGALPHAELARALREVSVLAYPNTFAETSCIAVMEAMASGCRVVTSDLGALPETTGGFARLVGVAQDREGYLREFVAAVVEVLEAQGAGNGEEDRLLQRQVAWLNEDGTPAARARQWVEWLEQLPPHAPPERSGSRVAQDPTTAAGWNERGIALAQQGRPAEAETCFRQALEIDPAFVQAESNLGIALQDQGRTIEALVCYRRALRLQPDYANAQNNAGTLLLEWGLLDEAAACFARGLELQPGFELARANLARVRREQEADSRNTVAPSTEDLAALLGLGVALQNEDLLDDALSCYRRVLRFSPTFAEAHNNLATILRRQGRLDEAVAGYRRAIDCRPEYADAYCNLGNALVAQGRRDEAVAAYRQCLQRTPDNATAHRNLGVALHGLHQIPEALDHFQQAVALKPDCAESHRCLGVTLTQLGRPGEAFAHLERALRDKPDDADLHNELGIAQYKSWRFDEAVASYERALRLRPADARFHNNLGTALQVVGRVGDAVACFREAIRLDPNYSEAHSNLVFAMHYHPDCDAASILQEYHRWNRQHAEPLRHLVRPHANRPDPERKLRIGYVSPDFREHVDAFFTIPLLSHHDHREFSVHCYANVRLPDAVTERQRGYADVWRDTLGLSDEALADLIRRDEIDILVDLEMHTASGRPLLFARRPAPVQVAWLGYPGTTGLSAMDYRLTDPYLDPPGLLDAMYVEESVRLPDTFWCYDPLSEKPAVGPLPAVANGHVTIGCLNNFAKINDGVLSLWARVLRAVPSSRLLMLVPPGQARARVLTTLQREGVAGERVEFVEWESRPDYLNMYNRFDLSLDPFPYNGHTTSLDALWMGIPLVTLIGRTVVGRAGFSQLSNLGLEELAAETPEQYVDIAVRLARDVPRLQALRAGLRERMRASPLMDGERFARAMEQVYRRIWRRWCAQQA